MDENIADFSDNEVLALCDLTMTEAQQSELADLLADQREGTLPSTQKDRLDELMQIYRHGLVRKSEALRIAMERGLRPPFG